MTTLEQVKKACSIAFTSSSPGERNEAVAFLETSQNAEGGMLMVVTLLEEDGVHEMILFWALKAFEHILRTRWSTSNLDDRKKARQCMLRFLTETVPKREFQPYVLNKAAVVVANIFAHEYPHDWPSFVEDVKKLITTNNMQVVNVFFKIFLTIDEDVVRVRAGNNHASKVSMEKSARIKDALRANDIKTLMGLWLNLVVGNHETNPAIAEQCLVVVDKYVHWIDINLTVNNQWFPTLVKILSNPALRNASVDVLYEVFEKKMPPALKLKLIGDTRILEIIRSLDAVKGPEDWAKQVAGLIGGVGRQLLDCVCASQSDAVPALDMALELGFPFLNSSWRISAECVELFIKYWSLVRREAARMAKLQARQQIVQGHFEKALLVMGKLNRLPPGINPEELCIGVAETEFATFRMEMDKLLKVLTLVNPKAVLTFAENQFDQLLRRYSTTMPYHDVEAVLHVIYQCGEYMSKNEFAQLKDAYAQIIDKLIGSGVSRHDHFTVSIEYFSLTARYVDFIGKNPSHLKEVIFSYVDERGMGNRSTRVRSRCAYLLTKFLSKIQLSAKLGVAEYANEIVSRYMYKYVKEFADRLVNVLSNQTNSEELADSEIEIQQHIANCMGWFLRSTVLGPEKSKEYTIEALKPLVNHLGMITVNKDAYMRQNPDFTGTVLSQLISLIGSFNKAFCNKTASVLTDIWSTTLTHVLDGFAVNPTHNDLRDRTIFFLFRMITCLRTRSLPQFQLALKRLWETANSENVVKTFGCTNMIIVRLKKPVAEMIATFLPLILDSCQKSLEEFSDINLALGAGESHRVCKKLEIQKQYYVFVSGILKAKIGDILLLPNRHAHFEKIVQSLLLGCKHNPPWTDAYMNKQCFSTLRILLDSLGSKIESVPQVANILAQDVALCIFNRITTLDNSEEGYSLLKEIVALQASLIKTFPNRLNGDQVAAFLREKLNFNQTQAQTYVTLLKQNKSMELANSLKAYLKPR